MINDCSSLSSEYAKIKRNYAKAKKQIEYQHKPNNSKINQETTHVIAVHRLEDCEKEKNEHDTFPLQRLPPNKPLDHKNHDSKQKELETLFVQDLKTCGLRGIREQKLFHMFQEITRSYRSRIDRWVEYTENLIHFNDDEIDRVNEELKGTLKASIDMQSRLDQSDKVCNDLQDAMKASQMEYEAKVDTLEKEKESIVESKNEQMKKFIQEMEDEICGIKLDMENEVKQVTHNLRRMLEKEQEDKEIENQQQISTLQAEVKNCILNLDKSKSDLEVTEKHLKQTQQDLHGKEDELRVIKLEVVNAKKENETKISSMKEQHQRELELIQEKIQQIVTTKDQELNKALERALVAEEEAKELDTFVKNIEEGLNR